MNNGIELDKLMPPASPSVVKDSLALRVSNPKIKDS